MKASWTAVQPSCLKSGDLLTSLTSSPSWRMPRRPPVQIQKTYLESMPSARAWTCKEEEAGKAGNLAPWTWRSWSPPPWWRYPPPACSRPPSSSAPQSAPVTAWLWCDPMCGWSWTWIPATWLALWRRPALRWTSWPRTWWWSSWPRECQKSNLLWVMINSFRF